MKILLEISDSKASFFMEVLKNFSFVKKAETITEAKAELIQDIRQAVEEVNQMQTGNLEGRNAEDLIDEL